MHQRLEDRVLKFLIWFSSSVREPVREGRVARLVQSIGWETFISLTICLNTVFIVYTADYQMAHVGELPVWAREVETCFAILFLFELLLKLYVHKLYFFCNDKMSWNNFDLALVFFTVMASLAGEDSNATFLRSVRVLRVARALQILKFATQLRCILQSILGSLMSLFWAFMVLFFIFILFATALVQGLALHLSSPEAEFLDEEANAQLRKFFGSVTTTVLTFHFCSTGGDDWVDYAFLLYPTGIVNVVVFMFTVSFTHIALMNILTGIFVEKAIQLAIPDRKALAQEQRRIDAALAQDLRNILEELDVDGSGTITWQEFSTVASDTMVRTLLNVMGLDLRDAKMFFEMVKSSNGAAEIDISLLTDALMRMKGDATGFDVQAVAFRTYLLGQRMERLQLQLANIDTIGERAVPTSCTQCLGSKGSGLFAL